MKLALIKQFNGTFIPAYDSDLELSRKIKVSRVYQYEFKQPRNYLLLRKFMALINLCYQNQDIYSDIEDLRHDLTVEAGYYRTVKTFDNKEYKKAKSINFSNMDEAEFIELYGKVKGVIIRYVGATNQEIEEEILMYY